MRCEQRRPRARHADTRWQDQLHGVFSVPEDDEVVPEEIVFLEEISALELLLDGS